MIQKNIVETNPQEIRLEELCASTHLPTNIIIEIVAHGIVEPSGDTPNNWCFTATMVCTTRRALRLHNDLDIDWPGIALALSLIDEVQELRETNQVLEQRIERFHHCPRPEVEV
jgi:chaperone modulatory protein CbpM